MEAKLNIFEPKKTLSHTRKTRNDVEKSYLYLLEKHTQLLKRRKNRTKKTTDRIANLTKVNVFNREKHTYTQSTKLLF